ncbi:hypothetical protein LINPERPRIM_LOCUS11361 [Linum perenne]
MGSAGTHHQETKGSDEVLPESPIGDCSFRDKVIGAWNTGISEDHVVFSDESDVEEEDDDPSCPTIRIKAEDKIRVRRKFENVVIINTLGKNFPFTYMSKKIPQLWARKGGVEVFDISWGFYVVRFETIADEERAMFGGPWMIGDNDAREFSLTTIKVVFHEGSLNS